MSDMKDKILKDMFDDLYSFLKKRSDDKSNSNYYSRGSIHCSGLDSCIRQVVMDYFKFPKKDLTMAELLMFEIANFCHRLMTDWARQSDRFEMIGEEHDITKGLPDMVSGKCDIVIKHKESGLNILNDTKTAMPSAFKSYSNYLVKRSHELQGKAYNYGLKNLETLIDLVIFTYFDRGGTNAPIYVAMSDISDEILENTFDIYKEAIKEYEINKKLPDKEPLIFEKKNSEVYVKKSWQCDYCKFCDVSCGGYPDFDRKKAKKIGVLVNSLLCIDKNFGHIHDEIFNQYIKKENEIINPKDDKDFYNFVKKESGK